MRLLSIVTGTQNNRSEFFSSPFYQLLHYVVHHAIAIDVHVSPVSMFLVRNINKGKRDKQMMKKRKEGKRKNVESAKHGELLIASERDARN